MDIACMPNPRVYVLDDDPSARQGLARLLRTAAYDVRTYATIDEFVDTLDEEALGLIVLDLRLPGKPVEELRAELDARRLDWPIVVVTADDDVQSRQQAHALEAVAFFRKPVDGTALLDAVAWALRAKGTSGENRQSPANNAR